MEEIKNRDTERLLSLLDEEIDNKCEELREKHREAFIRKIFFLGCIFVFIACVFQAIFSILNISFIMSFIIYQIAALIIVLSLVPNLNKEVLWK